MRFLDSNIFVYYLAKDPRYGGGAKAILLRIQGGEEAATSTLTIAQACAYLESRKRFDVIPAFLALVRSQASLTKVETTYSDFVEAEALQARMRLDWRLWDDLVLAAQMKRLGISEIYSNDSDFDQIPGVQRIFK